MHRSDSTLHTPDPRDQRGRGLGDGRENRGLGKTG